MNYPTFWITSLLTTLFLGNIVLIVMKQLKKESVIAVIYLIVNFFLILFLFSGNGKEIYNFFIKNNINPINLIAWNLILAIVVISSFLISKKSHKS